MRALGLDVGSKTIGLALGDAESRVATPIGVVARAGHRPDAATIVARVEEHGIDTVVVGLPLELDGLEGHRARRVRAFMDVLRQALADRVAVETWDERFTTSLAERTMIEAGVSRARRKQVIDGLAAQLILQGWLDGRARPSEAREP